MNREKLEGWESILECRIQETEVRRVKAESWTTIGEI
jgi:hypothetical protein